jgi:hypothetical protein
MLIPLGNKDNKSDMIVTDIKYVLSSREIVNNGKTNQGKTGE